MKGEASVKGEVKGEGFVKSEAGRVKGEANNVKKEANSDFECYINKIDHSKKAIDFSALPEDIVKAELLNMGIRVCTLTKKHLAACIEDLWTYRKLGKIPCRFYEYNEEEAKYL